VPGQFRSSSLSFPRVVDNRAGKEPDEAPLQIVFFVFKVQVICNETGRWWIGRAPPRGESERKASFDKRELTEKIIFL